MEQPSQPVTLSQGPGNYGNSVHLFGLLLWFLHRSRFAPKNRNSSVIYIISCLVTQFQKIREVAEIEMELCFGVSRSRNTLYCTVMCFFFFLSLTSIPHGVATRYRAVTYYLLGQHITHTIVRSKHQHLSLCVLQLVVHRP